MTDPKDKKLDLQGLDWDDALAEWEEKSFLPEVARDRETQTPGSLQGTPAPPATAAKPLYVPPPLAAPSASVSAAPPRTSISARSVPNAQATTSARPASAPKAEARTPPPPRRAFGHPSRPHPELTTKKPARRSSLPFRASCCGRGPTSQRHDPQAAASDRCSRARARSVRLQSKRLPSISTTCRQRRERVGLPPPSSSSSDEAVFTSAKELPVRDSKALSDAPRRPRPTTPNLEAAAREGEMFDPFAEPDPFQGETPEEVAILDDTPNRPAEPGAAQQSGSDSPSVSVEVSPGPPLLQPTRRSFDPDTDTSVHLKNAIHAPERREYDPNEETGILSKAAVRASLGEPSDEDGEDLTRFRSRGELVEPLKPTQRWDDERPAQELLPEAARTSFSHARAEGLEAEARAEEDRSARARGLLAASEIRAILGESEAAEILAREAAATAPQLAMAPRQARALAPLPRDAAMLADALDAEGRQSPTQAGRIHDALLAADVLRLAGDSDGATKRWDQAVRIAPSDPRAPLGRAAERLARRVLSHPTLRLPDAPELAPLAEATARALKIRGVAHPNVTTDEPLPNDALRRTREAIATGELGAAAHAAAELSRIPELRDASSWLAAALAGVAPEARGVRRLAADRRDEELRREARARSTGARAGRGRRGRGSDQRFERILTRRSGGACVPCERPPSVLR